MTNMTNIINITPDREICIKFASHSTAAWQTNHLELRADCRTGQITPVSMLSEAVKTSIPTAQPDMNTARPRKMWTMKRNRRKP